MQIRSSAGSCCSSLPGLVSVFAYRTVMKKNLTEPLNLSSIKAVLLAFVLTQLTGCLTAMGALYSARMMHVSARAMQSSHGWETDEESVAN
jgi:hypothetical protein